MRRDSTHCNVIPVTGPSGRKWQLRPLVDIPPVEADAAPIARPCLSTISPSPLSVIRALVNLEERFPTFFL